MCTILVNRLEDLACPVNVWLGKLTALDMTPLGWLGRKTSTQTQSNKTDFVDQTIFDDFLECYISLSNFSVVYKLSIQHDFKSNFQFFFYII